MRGPSLFGKTESWGKTMYVVVDHRDTVISGYTSGFAREGFASMGFCSGEFKA
jgi:hypothetical protein